MTTTSEQIALEILAQEALSVRSLAQDWMRRGLALRFEPEPSSDDAVVRGLAAAIVELLAWRTGQPAPRWVSMVGPLSSPLYLVEAANRSPKLRERIERESPEPLRRRNVFAPPGYLEMI